MAEIIAVAESLEAARADAASRIPSGEMALAEKVECDGRPVTLRAIGSTADDAWAEAQSRLPADAVILEKKMLRDASVQSVDISAEDEASGRAAALAPMHKEAVVTSLVQTDPGKRGFLGIGRRAPAWRAEVFCPAAVELQYRRDARIVIRTGMAPSSWEELLAAVGAGAGPELVEACPYHAQFVVLAGKLNDARHYRGIPFVPVGDAAVREARRYIDDPKLPGMLAMFPGRLDRDRYRIVGGRHIGRMSNPAVDSLIVTTASCLPKKQLSIFDEQELARLSYDAIKHYADIPIVHFFFSLPHLEKSRITRQIDPLQCRIEALKGTEALLLEIWDELADGQVITDTRVERKALDLFNRANVLPAAPAPKPKADEGPPQRHRGPQRAADSDETSGGSASSVVQQAATHLQYDLSVQASSDPPSMVKIDGIDFPLFTSAEAFGTLVQKENRGALRFRSVEYGSVLGRLSTMLPKERTDDLFASLLLCAGCMWQFPGSYMLSLQAREHPLPFVAGATPGFDRFGETGACPQCGAEESMLVFEYFPPDEITQDDLEAIRTYWHDQAHAWWQSQSRSEGICERCNAVVARGEGCLSGSDLLCAGCIERGLMTEGLGHLRTKPHYYGAALLRKARAART